MKLQTETTDRDEKALAGKSQENDSCDFLVYYRLWWKLGLRWNATVTTGLIGFVLSTILFFQRERERKKTSSGMQHYPAAHTELPGGTWHAGWTYHVLGCITHILETSSMNSDGFIPEAVEAHWCVLHLLLGCKGSSFSICWLTAGKPEMCDQFGDAGEKTRALLQGSESLGKIWWKYKRSSSFSEELTLGIVSGDLTTAQLRKNTLINVTMYYFSIPLPCVYTFPFPAAQNSEV